MAQPPEPTESGGLHIGTAAICGLVLGPTITVTLFLVGVTQELVIGGSLGVLLAGMVVAGLLALWPSGSGSLSNNRTPLAIAVHAIVASNAAALVWLVFSWWIGSVARDF
jgi:hypothetical protein